MERRLLKVDVASSTAHVCGRKRLGVANNGKNVTPWCNQEVKDAIQATKVACKVMASDPSQIFFAFAVYVEARKSVSSTHGETAQNAILVECRR